MSSELEERLPIALFLLPIGVIALVILPDWFIGMMVGAWWYGWGQWIWEGVVLDRQRQLEVQKMIEQHHREHTVPALPVCFSEPADLETPTFLRRP